MINRSALLLCFVLAAVPAFSAQHGAPRSKSAVVDVGDQDTIREIVEIEHQAREATLRRDADFPLRMLADDYVAIMHWHAAQSLAPFHVGQLPANA